MRRRPKWSGALNLLLVAGFLNVVAFGATKLVDPGVPAAAVAALADGREALLRDDPQAALGHFRAVLTVRPDSAEAALGAACAAWLIGRGGDAMVYRQMAVLNGLDFVRLSGCFQSPTPRLLFRTVRVGAAVLLYRRPDVDDLRAAKALSDAVGAAERGEIARATVLVGCVNARGGVDALAAMNAALAGQMVIAERERVALLEEFRDCAKR